MTLVGPTELNFNALLALGGATHGTSEIGEMVATVERINTAGASYQTYFDEFMARGDQLAAEAKEAEDGGHTVSARDKHRRASQYYNQGLFFVLGTSDPAREPEIYAQVEAQWDASTQLEAPPFERVEIPYEGRTLKGFFLAARGVSGPRPTVIVQNGSDAQHVDVWSFGGAAAIERGYHALLFEGPGQGAELFADDVPFRPDWEAVITPVVDHLSARPDVDAAKIALTGWSFSGSLVVRAAAQERRVAAVVADPGGVAPWLAYPDFLRAFFDNGATQEQVNRAWAGIVPSIPPEQQFGIRKRSEIFGGEFLAAARRGEMFTDFWTLGQTLMSYDITTFARRRPLSRARHRLRGRDVPARAGPAAVRHADGAQGAPHVHRRRRGPAARRAGRPTAPQRGGVRLARRRAALSFSCRIHGSCHGHSPATILSAASGPHVPGAYDCTGGGASSSGCTTRQHSSIPS